MLKPIAPRQRDFLRKVQHSTTQACRAHALTSSSLLDLQWQKPIEAVVANIPLTFRRHCTLMCTASGRLMWYHLGGPEP